MTTVIGLLVSATVIGLLAIEMIYAKIVRRRECRRLFEDDDYSDSPFTIKRRESQSADEMVRR